MKHFTDLLHHYCNHDHRKIAARFQQIAGTDLFFVRICEKIRNEMIHQIENYSKKAQIYL